MAKAVTGPGRKGKTQEPTGLKDDAQDIMYGAIGCPRGIH